MEWSHNITVLAGHSSAGHYGWFSGNTVRHHQSAWGHSGPCDPGSTGGMVSSNGSKAGHWNCWNISCHHLYFVSNCSNVQKDLLWLIAISNYFKELFWRLHLPYGPLAWVLVMIGFVPLGRRVFKQNVENSPSLHF